MFIMILLFTFPFFMIFAIFFGSILMSIITTLLTILLMYKSDESSTKTSGILFLLFGGLFYLFISLNHGLKEIFSGIDRINLYMTLAELASVAGFVSFVYFIRNTFHIISNFFTSIFEKVYSLFHKNGLDNINVLKFTNEELNNYYLYNSEYINWLHLYSNHKSFIKTGISNNLDVYRINKNEYNIKNLSRFYSSLVYYYEKNNIKINDNPSSRFIIISYRNKTFEIGIYKLAGGYVYCKVIINSDPSMLIIPFENILNSNK